MKFYISLVFVTSISIFISIFIAIFSVIFSVVCVVIGGVCVVIGGVIVVVCGVIGGGVIGGVICGVCLNGDIPEVGEQAEDGGDGHDQTPFEVDALPALG